MAYKLIGKDFTPVDVVAKVTGRAKYAEDFRADRMAFCKTLSSPMPHARIRNIDTSAAMKVPGVIGILTADDVPQFPPPQPPILSKDVVLYVGHPILAVAAESEAAATLPFERALGPPGNRLSSGSVTCGSCSKSILIASIASAAAASLSAATARIGCPT